MHRWKNNFPSTLLSDWLRPAVIKGRLTREWQKRSLLTYTSHLHMGDTQGNRNNSLWWPKPPPKIPFPAKYKINI